MRDSKVMVYWGMILFAVIVLGLALGCSQPKSASIKSNSANQSGQSAGTSNEAENAAYYVCPMHPEIKSTDPSVKCSICGMALVPSSEGETQEQLYACPMHPEITSTDPDVKCSVCGMKLEPVKEIEKDAQIYACPMHPKEHSTDPNAKCSICGMDLKPVSEDK